MRSTILSTLLVLTLLACSKEENHSEQQKIECDQLVLNQGTTYPTEKIYIEGIDEKQEDNLIVEFWYNNTFTEVSTSLGLDENGKSFIIAPVHPQHPIAGGELQVIVKNLSDEIICNTQSITILELPEADGYTDKVALGLEQLLKQRTDYLNIDEALLSGDLANIEPTDVPFAMLYNLLHNEEAEFALIPFLNNDSVFGTKSIDKATSIDLSSRLLKKYGVLDYLNQNIQDFESEHSKMTNGKKETSDRCFGIDADDLAIQMKAATNTEYSDPSSITGKYFNDLSNVASSVGYIPQAATASTIFGSIVWAIQKAEEAYSKTRLSHFTKFDVGILNTEFLEEKACPEPIITAEVYAGSNEWSIDRTIWDFLMQAASYAPTPNSKNIWEDLGFTAVSNLTSKQLTNLANLGYWDEGWLTIPAIECGPIDVLSQKYIKSDLLNNVFEAEFKQGGGIEFYPIATGEDVLELSLRTEVFSGQTISFLTNLFVVPINLEFVNPNTTVNIIEPGEVVDLEVWLDNTLIELKNNLKVSTSIGETGLSLTEEYSMDSTYVQKYNLQTPVDPSQYPITVTAKYTSDKCFRGTEYANPAIDEITIDRSKITVYTDDLFGCFQVGDEKDFNVIVEGEDKEVTWSAQNESGQNFAISQEGIFTAPNEAGKYIIKAELQSNPEIFDTLETEVVGSCSCYWSYSTNEASASYDIAWYTVSDTGMDIRLHNDFDNILDEEIWIYIPNEFLPGEGETKVTSGTQTPQTLKMPIQCFNIKGGFGPTSFNATIKWKNQYLEANITGVFLSETDEGEEYDLPFTLIFGANEGILNCDGN